MQHLHSIVYHYLTDADFFNIYKPRGAESRGGGQSYIDFSTAEVPISMWDQFFEGLPELKKSSVAHGPSWTFPIRSIGVDRDVPQYCTVFQRRRATISFAKQKLGTKESNRVHAWHPDNGFPLPSDRTNRNQCPNGLVVYLARTKNGIWAGWFLNDGRSPLPFNDEAIRPHLGNMLTVANGNNPRTGFISCSGILLDEMNRTTSFVQDPGVRAQPESGRQVVDYSDSDTAVSAFFDNDSVHDVLPLSYNIAKVRRRNTKAVNRLKNLYKNTCQITGTDFLFKTREGEYYVEVHHLIPLGKGGADTPNNMVVLSPQLHSMLHHASVSEIDLSKMEEESDGRWSLDIEINGKKYKIRWDPLHAKLVNGSE